MKQSATAKAMRRTKSAMRLLVVDGRITYGEAFDLLSQAHKALAKTSKQERAQRPKRIKGINKREGIRALKKKLTEPFHRWIKLRDSTVHGNRRIGHCITCSRLLVVCQVHGGTVIWNPEAQAGHYWPKGRYEALRFDPDNVHLQCSYCNRNEGERQKYSGALLRRIGLARMNNLDLRKNNRPNYIPALLRRNIEKYSAVVAEAEKDLLK